MVYHKAICMSLFPSKMMSPGGAMLLLLLALQSGKGATLSAIAPNSHLNSVCL